MSAKFCDWWVGVTPVRVYRPHRRAVVQSLFSEKVELGYALFPRVRLQARLGCPRAVAWMKWAKTNRNRFHGLHRGQPWRCVQWPGVEAPTPCDDDDPGDLPEHYLWARYARGARDGTI